MIVLTPAERRAVLLLVLLLALGAASDLMSGRGVVRAVRAPPDTSSEAAPGAGDPSPAPSTLVKGAAGETLDLNRATARQLDDLPGVGPVLASRILEQRRRYGSFRAIEDLRAVRGIGPRLFERVRSRLRVGPAAGDSSSERVGQAPPASNAPARTP